MQEFEMNVYVDFLCLHNYMIVADESLNTILCQFAPRHLYLNQENFNSLETLQMQEVTH